MCRDDKFCNLTYYSSNSASRIHCKANIPLSKEVAFCIYYLDISYWFIFRISFFIKNNQKYLKTIRILVI